jgi:RimJ/RimL family protein N-acetyltransferase
MARLHVSAIAVPDLRDEAFALRPWRERDLPGLVEGFGDPVVQRFSWPGVAPYSEADGRAFIASRTKWLGDGTCADLAIVAPDDDDQILGGASIYDIEAESRQASTGYWLAPAARGRGIATRAVRLLARWAFEDLGVERLQLTCGPDNVGSQRVAERAGFTREGVLRSQLPFKGQRRDTVVFSLLPGEIRG